jgi:hypothetical protein
VGQTSYAEQAPAFAGMPFDLSWGMVKDTFIQGEASAEIPFGAFVVQSAAPTLPGTATAPNVPTAKLPAASGDNFGGGGIVLHSHWYDKRLQLGTTGVKPGNLLTVVRRGRLWVNGEVALAITDAVYARYTASGGNTPGNFRNNDDTSKALRLYGCRFLTGLTAAGLVAVEIDLNAHLAH